MHVIWAGDFNTVPRSPLYKFIKTGSTADLQRFKASAWTGQHAAAGVHLKMESSLKRKVDMIGEEFNANKHSRYLYQEEDLEYFPKLYRQICLYKLTLESGIFHISIDSCPAPYQAVSLRSAYSDAYKSSGRSHRDSAGEIEWSTMTVQESYPFTVDYIL